MLQLNNSTPFAANMALFPDQHGVDTLYLMVKGSFNISQNLTLTDKQLPPLEVDDYWGEPDKSSIKFASDFHIGKPATDIVMLGNACAPGSEPVRELDVSLTVGQVNKTVRVFGDRVWKNGQITMPEPFQAMPMVYEKAFGGTHVVDEQILSQEDRNPVGCGFVGERSESEMSGMPLPNLEDPACLIRQIKDRPVPCCFALSAPGWQPRLAYAGTYDEQWQQQRAPFLPTDFDSRFFNMAHEDLIYPGFLQGGEEVHITNMHPGGNLHFMLPRINFVSSILLENQTLSTGFNLETLILEPNQAQMSMVWRSSVPCDKKTLKIKKIDIALSR